MYRVQFNVSSKVLKIDMSSHMLADTYMTYELKLFPNVIKILNCFEV